MDLRDFVSSRAEGDIDGEFLKSLSQLPLTLIEPEQAQIEAQLDVVTSAYRNLGSKHCDDFVNAHNSLNLLMKLVQDMKQVSTDASEVVSSVPRVGERGYASVRQLARDELQVYLEISKIQDLLQLPELVKTCISGKQYGTALDLAGLSGRLRGRYPTIITVVNVANEVDRLVDSIQNDLETTLRESSRLPQLMKAVTLLRRIPNNTHQDLQLLFVSSRQQFLKLQWETNAKGLKQFVDLFREHVFATITGHSAIFEGDVHENVIAEFVRWATESLLHRLESEKLTESQDRSALWLQLAFCSHSLGRVGASFWSLLGSLLVPKNILTEEEWRDAHARQQDMVRQAAKLTT